MSMIVKNQTNNIDNAIYEAEKEIENGAIAIDANIVFAKLDAKYFHIQ